MESRTRSLCLRIFALALATIYSLKSAPPALANPIPMPLPLMMADYTPRPFPANRSLAYFSPRFAGSLYSPWSASNVTPDTGMNMLRRGNTASLLNSLSSMNDNAEDLRTLAAKSGTVDENDYDYQANCAAALTSFSQNMDAFQRDFTVASTVSDKGLANYNKNEVLEDMLKKVANANKDILNSVYKIVNGLPVVGPILGPIVYQIKCIVIDVQNALEDVTDGTINGLENILKPLLAPAGCPGNEMLDICL